MSGRRDFLAFGAGAVAARSVPPIAAAQAAGDAQDAMLLRLGAQMAEAIEREKAAWAVLDPAVDIHDDDDPDWMISCQASDAVAEIVERIGTLPATGLPGVLVKIRAILWCRFGDTFQADDLERNFQGWPPSTNSQVLASLMNDLAAMASTGA